uniref:Uncharacterized protein n=1 Tax=Aegilops tauschii subsp. strangulata TaxID=200361 RepID=A0A453N0B1_AEGTS
MFISHIYGAFQTIRKTDAILQLAALAGDFLLFRAFSAAGSLENTEVVSLLATALNNLVTGELMQMTVTPAQRCSMDYYLQKTYYKTAALISNSCKAVAVLSGQTAEVAGLAYQYGRHLGIAYQLTTIPCHSDRV